MRFFSRFCFAFNISIPLWNMCVFFFPVMADALWFYSLSNSVLFEHLDSFNDFLLHDCLSALIQHTHTTAHVNTLMFAMPLLLLVFLPSSFSFIVHISRFIIVYHVSVGSLFSTFFPLSSLRFFSLFISFCSGSCLKMVRCLLYISIPFILFVRSFLFSLIHSVVFYAAQFKSKNIFFYDFEWLHECCSIRLQNRRAILIFFLFHVVSECVCMFVCVHGENGVWREHWKHFFPRTKHKPFRLSDGFICADLLFIVRLLALLLCLLEWFWRKNIVHARTQLECVCVCLCVRFFFSGSKYAKIKTIWANLR